MLTRLREVRRARGLTLEDVACRCRPPTTAQTIGRLETGARTVSIGWLQRIASAMGVEPQDLLTAPQASELKVVAILGPEGTQPPTREAIVIAPRIIDPGAAVLVTASVGEYRAGDELWCEILQPQDYGQALNRDILVPRAGGRFVFGRLINRDAEKLQLLRLEPGGRQQVLPSPSWLAVARKLVRSL